MATDTHIITTKTLAEFFDAYYQHPTKILLLRGNIFSKGDIGKIARVLGLPYYHGAFAEVREIKPAPTSTSSLALTAAAHPPHLDGTFAEVTPSAFLLSVVRSDEGNGGTSQFWPINGMLAECPADYVEALQRAVVRYERPRADGSKDSFEGNILSKDTSGETVFRWRNDEYVRPEVIEPNAQPIEEAIKWVESYLDRCRPLELQAEAGDTFLVRQRFYLHGRSALSSAASNRLLYRTWIY